MMKKKSYSIWHRERRTNLQTGHLGNYYPLFTFLDQFSWWNILFEVKSPTYPLPRLIHIKTINLVGFRLHPLHYPLISQFYLYCHRSRPLSWIAQNTESEISSRGSQSIFRRLRFSHSHDHRFLWRHLRDRAADKHTLLSSSSHAPCSQSRPGNFKKEIRQYYSGSDRELFHFLAIIVSPSSHR